MRLFTALQALVVTSLLTGGAYAQPDQPLTMDDPSFDWNGFYAGMGFSVGMWSDTTTLYMPEAVAGYNVTIDQVLLGVEGTISQGFNSIQQSAFQAAAKARGGVLVTDAVLIYASGGIGYFCLPNTVFATAGAGVEFAINDTMTLDIEYEYWYRPGLSSNTVDASILFHF